MSEGTFIGFKPAAPQYPDGFIGFKPPVPPNGALVNSRSSGQVALGDGRLATVDLHGQVTAVNPDGTTSEVDCGDSSGVVAVPQG